jgi:uncharacterized membrane protein (UPF0127 family)
MRRATIALMLGALVVSACSGGTPRASTPITADPATTTPADVSDDVSDDGPSEADGSERDGSGQDGSGQDGSERDGSVAPDAVVPEGFELVQATVTEPDGTVCELCVWVADTPEQRARGLMFVTDLGPADAMAFVYPGPHSGSFWMKDTLLPLSIAFFDADGRYVDSFDMEPCTADPCPQYTTPDGFLVAVEVEQGSLTDVGMVPGSVLALSDLACPD